MDYPLLYLEVDSGSLLKYFKLYYYINILLIIFILALRSLSILIRIIFISILIRFIITLLLIFIFGRVFISFYSFNIKISLRVYYFLTL